MHHIRKHFFLFELYLQIIEPFVNTFYDIITHLCCEPFKVQSHFNHITMNNSKSLLMAILAISILWTGCSSSKNLVLSNSELPSYSTQPRDFERDAYVVDWVYTEAKAKRFWLLFIPFGGGKSKLELAERAGKKIEYAASRQGMDGLLGEPQFTYEKSVVPLILFNFSTRKVIARAKAYRLKTEQEYQESKRKSNN